MKALLFAVLLVGCASPVGTESFSREQASDQTSATFCGTFSGAHGYEGVPCQKGQVTGGSCKFSAGTNHGSHLDTDVIGRTVWACESDLVGAVTGSVEICTTVECQ